MSDNGTRIVVSGVRPYDGEYELDDNRTFNTREWNWIKRLSGYMPLTVADGFAGGDPDLFVALAVIAMCRSGKIDRNEGLRVAEVLAEAPFDGTTIQLVGGTTEEDDAVPPVLTSEPAGSSPASSLTNNSSETPRQPLSGMPSTTSSEEPDATPPPTGTGGSDTLPMLVRTGSAS